ncbi:hypothetical protein QJU11_09970 [Pasteurella atlantica]|uniref:hypothetical protein n=1 Tax=Phocoenobacter atlanticus TaxID=3416742 RepID=UPI0027519001|nr:hypothetical protein [Pasteurella atlantica]MDP8042517.1 hypothetical protein [Pasteurella atlantica]
MNKNITAYYIYSNINQRENYKDSFNELLSDFYDFQKDKINLSKTDFIKNEFYELENLTNNLLGVNLIKAKKIINSKVKTDDLIEDCKNDFYSYYLPLTETLSDYPTNKKNLLAGLKNPFYKKSLEIILTNEANDKKELGHKINIDDYINGFFESIKTEELEEPSPQEQKTKKLEESSLQEQEFFNKLLFSIIYKDLIDSETESMIIKLLLHFIITDEKKFNYYVRDFYKNSKYDKITQSFKNIPIEKINNDIITYLMNGCKKYNLIDERKKYLQYSFNKNHSIITQDKLVAQDKKTNPKP